MILTLPRAQAPALPPAGCWPVSDWQFLASATWQERASAEIDEQHLQLIPYLLLRNAAGQVWCYQRTGGDARLHGRCSCGVGGHVDAADAVDRPLPATDNSYLEDSCSRNTDKGYSPISYINAQATLQRALLRELTEELQASGFRSAQAIAADDAFELWSRLAAQHLVTLLA